MIDDRIDAPTSSQHTSNWVRQKGPMHYGGIYFYSKQEAP